MSFSLLKIICMRIFTSTWIKIMPTTLYQPIRNLYVRNLQNVWSEKVKKDKCKTSIVSEIYGTQNSGNGETVQNFVCLNIIESLGSLLRKNWNLAIHNDVHFFIYIFSFNFYLVHILRYKLSKSATSGARCFIILKETSIKDQKHFFWSSFNNQNLF